MKKGNLKTYEVFIVNVIFLSTLTMTIKLLKSRAKYWYYTRIFFGGGEWLMLQQFNIYVDGNVDWWINFFQEHIFYVFFIK